MFTRPISKCILPVIKSTSTSTCGWAPLQPQLARVAPVLPFLDKKMPTQLLDAEQLESLSCGTGQPAQRGHRRPLVWKRRQPWFDHQWTLDLKRVKKGPETPHFPEGVPFTQIRAFQSFSGPSFKINAGRRRKIRLSLKRGRRKLL
ncbi:hypothetical protein STCU_03941 [Strigomonas culicis]|uniref:Uncharacterized protein n=1 Tax=Strigomonas culicis TaxID=28005 RepID=S9VU70_9TRYP|nr:hypothetical protein STCU_03941 [Strigomonas culicis]|eukprot:EPY30691.1 hypothetical protein STCU_03941 [Strigomonas culicis]